MAKKCKKTTRNAVYEFYEELLDLKPTPKEIQEFADLLKGSYGVVTYSKSRGGGSYFIRFHNTWKQKFSGKIHVDIGYVDEKYRHKWNVLDTTHLMLDKKYCKEFIDFIKKKREVL